MKKAGKEEAKKAMKKAEKVNKVQKTNDAKVVRGSKSRSA